MNINNLSFKVDVFREGRQHGLVWDGGGRRLGHLLRLLWSSARWSSRKCAGNVNTKFGPNYQSVYPVTAGHLQLTLSCFCEVAVFVGLSSSSSKAKSSQSLFLLFFLSSHYIICTPEDTCVTWQMTNASLLCVLHHPFSVLQLTQIGCLRFNLSLPEVS